MSAPLPAIAVRGSTGVSLSYGPPSYENVSEFVKDVSKSCKTLLFSPQGQYFAWVNGAKLKIVNIQTWSLIAEISRPKSCSLAFSPLGTYLLSWEPFVAPNATQDSQGQPNLFIYKSATGDLVKSFIHKKQIGWEPQWSVDEKLCARCINNQLVFYEDANFEHVVHTINKEKVGAFSIAPGRAPYHFISYVPGKQGARSLGRINKYPNFETVIASKGFFQADRVEFFWNNKGTSVLLMTSMEVDKTGASYYGKQTLHYLSTKGETAMVVLSKEGPIHTVEWSPKATEFCIIYGFMPSRATLFNSNCEPIFEFGTGPRNAIYYNPHGNILLLGGFGNLRGQIELWDAPARKLIAKCDAPDTTQIQWSPDGVHFATATTAPRLRMANGYKIWHYTGTLLYERPWNSQEELYEVCWQTYPDGVFPEKPINYTPVEGITSSQPQASKQVYRPPSARGKETNFKLHDDDEPPRKPGDSVVQQPSKAAIKQKKKREAQKARRLAEDTTSTRNPSESRKGERPQSAFNIPKSPQTNQHNPSSSCSSVNNNLAGLTGDPDKDKKIKSIKRKLEAIAKLKEIKASGKPLEINQIAKINTEIELLDEIKELSL